MIKQRIFPDVHVRTVRGASCRNDIVHLPATARSVEGGALIVGRQELDSARVAAEAFGLIGLPAAVLTCSHRLVVANKLLEELIPQIVQDRPSRIGLADRRADAMLAQSLFRLQSHGGQQVCSIPIAATPEVPASIVHVVPVRGVANDIFTAASCVLLITTVERWGIASTEVIQGLFDLTPAEARVARGIAAGKTIDELADEAGLAALTVRNQLKSVFRKTGVSRQADLVGILVGSALNFPSISLQGRAPLKIKRFCSARPNSMDLRSSFDVTLRP
jgi:DNA-binding CsgD family transcriptional regulator